MRTNGVNIAPAFHKEPFIGITELHVRVEAYQFSLYASSKTIHNRERQNKRCRAQCYPKNSNQDYEGWP